MNGGVWMCNSLGSVEFWGEVTNPWRDEETPSQRMMDLSRANEVGEVLPREAFPPQVHGQLSAKESDYKFTDLFIANALPVVSGRLSEVLRRFDLGSASLHPVPVFKKDKEMSVEGDWYFLNFGNVKHAFIPEQSKGIGFEQIEGTELWIMGAYGKPDDIAVSSEALVGPDIWVEPRCVKVFFLSDRLASVIKDDGLTGFDLVRCKVV